MKTCEGVDVEKKRESFTSSKLHHVYKRKGLQQCNRFMGSAQDFASFCNCFSYLRSFVTDAIATSSGDDCIRIFQQVIHNQIVLQIFYVWYCTSQFRKLLYNTLANHSFAEPTETFQPLILLTTRQLLEKEKRNSSIQSYLAH